MIEVIKNETAKEIVKILFPEKTYETISVFYIDQDPENKWVILEGNLKGSKTATEIIGSLNSKIEEVGVCFISNGMDSCYFSPEVIETSEVELFKKFKGGMVMININSPLNINKKEYLHISLIHELGHARQRLIGMFNGANEYISKEKEALEIGGEAKRYIENDNILYCEHKVCEELGIMGSRTKYD